MNAIQSTFLYTLLNCSNFRTIMVIFLGVPIFRISFILVFENITEG